MGVSAHVWILWRRRKGDLDQMQRLVTTLGWTHEIKRLNFRGPDIPALAPLLLAAGSDPLTPPWPTVVMCAEALPSIIARRLKRKSGGVLKAVCIGRPAGSPRAFDLIITTPQYRIAPAANVVELSLPLAAPRTDGAPPPYPSVPRRPLIAVLVGGASFPDRLDGQIAAQLVRDICQYTDRLGGTMAMVTSPRSGAEVVSALESAVAPPHRLHVYSRDGNQYRALLATADEIIVTSDSVSMAADAVETGKPAFVYPLPLQIGMQWRVTAWLHTWAVEKPSALLLPIRWLLDAGVFEMPADRRRLFSRLVSERRIAWFGGAPPDPQPGADSQNLTTAADSLGALVRQQSAVP